MHISQYLDRIDQIDNRRHLNKSVGMGKLSRIKKRRAYVYSGVNSNLNGSKNDPKKFFLKKTQKTRLLEAFKVLA